MPPIPDFVRNDGDFWIISRLASTKVGATAVNVFLNPFQVIAATEEQNPSTLAAVGQDIKLMFSFRYIAYCL